MAIKTIMARFSRQSLKSHQTDQAPSRTLVRVVVSCESYYYHAALSPEGLQGSDVTLIVQADDTCSDFISNLQKNTAAFRRGVSHFEV
jgi:hypothetical protein